LKAIFLGEFAVQILERIVYLKRMERKAGDHPYSKHLAACPHVSGPE
jgi:hypothetical protein